MQQANYQIIYIYCLLTCRVVVAGGVGGSTPPVPFLTPPVTSFFLPRGGRFQPPHIQRLVFEIFTKQFLNFGCLNHFVSLNAIFGFSIEDYNFYYNIG